MKKLKTAEAPPGEAKFKNEALNPLQDASTSSDAILASATTNLIDDPASGSKKRKQEDLNTSDASEVATAVNSETPGIINSETPRDVKSEAPRAVSSETSSTVSSETPSSDSSVVATAVNLAVAATVYTFVHVEVNSVFLSSDSSGSSWKAFDIEWDDLNDSHNVDEALVEEAELRTKAWARSHRRAYDPQSRYPSDAEYVKHYLFEMQWPTEDDDSDDDEEYLLGEMLGDELTDEWHGWLHFAFRVRSWADPWIEFEETKDGSCALVPKQIGKIFCVSDDEKAVTLVNAKEFWDAKTWGKALAELVDELRAIAGPWKFQDKRLMLHSVIYIVFTEDEANVEKKAQE
ncbi:hypothetical protein F5X68DRAFT_277644 [Plectosphaerella plurivora]|uniref:Uncharacterized protein n=1 Tax=Plectosphaerella plurivora TaxID=936078 RepID=A0A9P8V4G0_9PEZI|nr:hypothetical protein F5X68DRAFT_277644 [Plectosphaerella plurivora]